MAEIAPVLTPILGGFHVKNRADGEYCIDVMQMLYNFRIVLSPVTPQPHQQVAHGWCYYGHGLDADGNPRTMQTALLAAMAAAQVWDGYGNPPGYDKQAC